MNSKYVVTWVEIRATKGIVTVKDQMVIGLRLFTRSKRSSIYLHFDSKARAIDFIKGIEDLTDTEQEAFYVWLNYKSIDFTKKDAYDLIRIFKDDYVGEYDDEEDFA